MVSQSDSCGGVGDPRVGRFSGSDLVASGVEAHDGQLQPQCSDLGQTLGVHWVHEFDQAPCCEYCSQIDSRDIGTIHGNAFAIIPASFEVNHPVFICFVAEGCGKVAIETQEC